jgi:hypothetical protein
VHFAGVYLTRALLAARQERLGARYWWVQPRPALSHTCDRSQLLGKRLFDYLRSAERSCPGMPVSQLKAVAAAYGAEDEHVTHLLNQAEVPCDALLNEEVCGCRACAFSWPLQDFCAALTAVTDAVDALEAQAPLQPDRDRDGAPVVAPARCCVVL